MHSIIVSNIINRVKNDLNFTNSKRKKKDVNRDYMHGKRHTKYLLDFINDMIDLANDISYNELTFCESKI